MTRKRAPSAAMGQSIIERLNAEGFNVFLKPDGSMFQIQDVDPTRAGVHGGRSIPIHLRAEISECGADIILALGGTPPPYMD
jgi:hypothetical protein